MRFFISSIIILTIAMLIGYHISSSHGAVIIIFKNLLIQTSLLVGIFAIFSIFMTIFFATKIFSTILNTKTVILYWSKTKKNRKNRFYTQKGLEFFAKGYWNKAESMLKKSARYAKKPLFNWLLAARAAHAQNAYDRRDHFLRLADGISPSVALPVGLTQAELQIQAKQWEQALSTTQRLLESYPKHPFILKMMSIVLTALEEWEKCIKIANAIKNQNALTSKELRHFLKNALYYYLLSHSATSIDQLNYIWSKAPKEIQQDENIFVQYLSNLKRLDAQHDAAQISKKYLKKHWSESVLKQYHENNTISKEEKMQHYEQWHQNQPSSHTLLLHLCEICFQLKLYGKAYEYSKKYHSRVNDLQSILMHARICQQIGKNTEYAEALAEAMNQTTLRSSSTDKKVSGGS